MKILVVEIRGIAPKEAVVNVYHRPQQSPLLKDILLPFSVFPHDPRVGEQFTLSIERN